MCNQLLLQFSMDLFETLNIMKTCMWIFDEARVNFDRIMMFRTWSL